MVYAKPNNNNRANFTGLFMYLIRVNINANDGTCICTSDITGSLIKYYILFYHQLTAMNIQIVEPQCTFHRSIVI